MIRYAAAFPYPSNVMEYWMPAFAGMTAFGCEEGAKSAYFIAEKRLSNEFAGTIGCEPAT